ncbi:hypothetical protein H8B13_11830 [Hymenobacter sp. BT188]|uniref:hypothetical protein n=1 Tax=Hymenobacter sp. BT188 TaxID=2763504 RepID=UPI001650FD79|nr:hypothetical protein [Hymenobacter sp. BT188]MBC6607509.1 hypothetical protein [Hymenobacter sp. BT188]
MTLFSCNKEEIAPQTGDLVIAFPYTAQLNGVPYYLFTEGIWTTPIRSATPLREGTMPSAASASTGGKARIEFKNLNAGNYVFVLGSNNWSVQVTAGQNTEVFK